jgi:glycosyltransferase involved in cell wall biosynthesis
MPVNMHADNKRPLVSVIIPAFNAAAIIERTIRSVTAQTYPELEILVVNDGSTDETGSVVRDLSAEDDRIELLTQENQGVSAARNLGIQHSSGEFVAPLDADDIWMPEKTEKQVEVFRTSPASVGVVYTYSERIFEDGRPSIYSASQEEGYVFFALLLGNFLQNASTPLIRRRCLDDVGTYSLDYRAANAQGCEDWDIYLRLAERYEYRVVCEYLTGYWQSTGSMSADWRLMDRSYRLMMDGVRKRHPDIPGYVLRWSRSNYFVYLAQRAAHASEVRSSLQSVLRAVVLDPFLLANRRLQRLVARNLLRLIRGDKSAPPVDGNRKPLAGQTGRRDRGIWGARVRQRSKRLDQLQKEFGRVRLSATVGRDSSTAGGA